MSSFTSAAFLIFTRAVGMLQQPREDEEASAESLVALHSWYVKPVRGVFFQEDCARAGAMAVRKQKW